MIDPLYQKEILRLAAAATGAGELPEASTSIKVKNPMCGDQIKLDARIENGRITAIAHETRACVLCQASASLITGLIAGETGEGIRTGRGLVEAMLQGTEPSPLDGSDWAAYSVFTPVIEHHNRHRCVLLPFDALIRAFEDAEG